MDKNEVRRLNTQYFKGSAAERGVPGDELNAIINTVEDMLDWLKDQISNVKDVLKGEAEKYKKKILKLKDLNGPVIPHRHQ
jgi:hypothetical protein